MLAREWRSGELGVLLLALTIAVASLSGVGFLVNRIGAAVDLQATEVLAADIRLGSPQPISQASVDEAARRGLRTARSTRLLSVVFHDDRSQLTNIHDLTIATTEAELATQLTTAVRDRAVAAFNSIMSMPV